MSDRQVTHGYIHISERPITSQRLNGYDVVVVCRNWEERSVSLLKRIDDFPIIVDVVFSDTPAPDFEDPLVNDLIEKARLDGRLRPLMLKDSVDIRPNCLILHRELSLLFGDSANILIDMTSIPKIYTLSIAGWCFSERCVPALSFFYQEGDYRSLSLSTGASPDEIKLASFTTGSWVLVQVPYLEGDMSLHEGAKLIAFCGGDHEHILTALSDYEHLHRWAVLTTRKPKEPDRVALDHAESLVQNAGLSNSNVGYADPMSAVDALICARDILGGGSGEGAAGGVILPFSTKPHALAAAVIGIFGPGVTVLARQPTGYVAQDIAPADRAVLLIMADLSSPFVAEML